MSFFSHVRRELRELRRNPWLFSLLSWVPLLLFSLIYLIFSEQIPRELPIGVADLDRSSVSRTLVRHYQASPTLAVDDSFPDPQAGAESLRNGDIFGLAIMPHGLGEDVALGRPAQVTVFVNDQFLLIGKIINSALLQAHGTFNAQVETGRNLFGGTPIIELAVSRAMPTASQVTPLFNLSVNYAQFLVSAILPAIWQILMIVTTILSLEASRSRYTAAGWLGETPVTRLLAKFIPLSVLFWLQGWVFLAAMYLWLGWPMHGSWPLVLLAQFLAAWASIAAGSLFFFVSGRVETGLSLAVSYAAPGLAFMGVTFPVTDMTLPARIWRSFLPVTHYVEVQFGQVNYGAPLKSAAPELVSLMAFSVVMLLVFRLAIRSQRSMIEGEGK